jgi:hypothetical protein
VLVMDGVDIPPYFPATEIEQQLSLVSKGNGVSLYEKKAVKNKKLGYQ